MTSFEHLKAKSEHAQSIDADVVRVDIEELASVIEELQELRNAKKNCRECYSRCLDCDKRLKAYNEGKADAIDEFADWLVKQGILGSRVVCDGEITDYGKLYAKRFKEQLKEKKE